MVRSIAWLSLGAALLSLAAPAQALENTQQTQKGHQIFVSPQSTECKAHPDECKPSSVCHYVCLKWEKPYGPHGVRICATWQRDCS